MWSFKAGNVALQNIGVACMKPWVQAPALQKIRNNLCEMWLVQLRS